MTKKKQHWAIGNTNAVKPEGEKNDVHLHVKCKSHDKAEWEKQAKERGLSLAKYVTQKLNEEI